MSVPATPTRAKRTRSTAGFTPDKMEYKISKTMDSTMADTVIKDANLGYLNTTAKYLQKLFSATGGLTMEKKEPTEIIKELLIKGALDKDLCITENDGGRKTSLKDALLNIKTNEESDAQPHFTPTMNPVQAEHTNPDTATVQSLAEIFNKWSTKNAEFMEQATTANEINSNRLSAAEVAILRKHFEDEQLKLYVTKINVTGVSSKNGWELAQFAKQTLVKKITEVFKDEAEKPISNCKMESIATSSYLKLSRALSSAKVDAMAKQAKHDQRLGYTTVALTITFASLEDKNTFKDKARDLGLNSKDSFPKSYAKQRDQALTYFKNSVIFNNNSIWSKADVRLGRIEDPICITIQTKKAESTERWETKARIQILPSSAWGRLSPDQRETHIKNGCD